MGTIARLRRIARKARLSHPAIHTVCKANRLGHRDFGHPLGAATGSGTLRPTRDVPSLRREKRMGL